MVFENYMNNQFMQQTNEQMEDLPPATDEEFNFIEEIFCQQHQVIQDRMPFQQQLSGLIDKFLAKSKTYIKTAKC